MYMYKYIVHVLYMPRPSLGWVEGGPLASSLASLSSFTTSSCLAYSAITRGVSPSEFSILALAPTKWSKRRTVTLYIHVVFTLIYTMYMHRNVHCTCTVHVHVYASMLYVCVQCTCTYSIYHVYVQIENHNSLGRERPLIRPTCRC